MERVCVFIDGSNLYHGVKEILPDDHLDIAKLITWLVGNRQLTRTYYYNVPISPQHNPTGASAQQRFFGALNRIPYLQIRLGRLEPRGAVFVEKGVDVGIAVDMLSMGFRNLYDTAILVSSDGDFAHAIHEVQELGKHVEVAHFARARAVSQAADVSLELNEVSIRPLLRPRRLP